jgi:hypothetical protein
MTLADNRIHTEDICMAMKSAGLGLIPFLLMLSMATSSNAQTVERPQVTPAQINEVVTKG